MSRPERKLVKCSVRLYEDDLAVVRDHYRDIGYNNLIRHFISRLAERIRNNRQSALQSLEDDIYHE